MKQLIQSLILALFLSIWFCACNHESYQLNEPENIIQHNNAIISDLQAEADSLYLPLEQVKRLTPKAKQERRYSLILAEHTYLNDNNYYIDITEEEASNLGIPSYYYIETINHLNIINDQIKQSIKKGARINLIDIRDSVAKLKQNKNYSISRGSYEPTVGIGGGTSFGEPDTIHATHRSNESFVGTIVFNVMTEMTDPQYRIGSLYADAISSPDFHDFEYKTIEYHNAKYYFNLKVKPFGLEPKYMIYFLSYPYYADVVWFNYYFEPRN